MYTAVIELGTLINDVSLSPMMRTLYGSFSTMSVALSAFGIYQTLGSMMAPPLALPQWAAMMGTFTSLGIRRAMRQFVSYIASVPPKLRGQVAEAVLAGKQVVGAAKRYVDDWIRYGTKRDTALTPRIYTMTGCPLRKNSFETGVGVPAPFGQPGIEALERGDVLFGDGLNAGSWKPLDATWGGAR